MKSIIRKLTLADLSAYRDIRLLAFKEASESFSESYEDEKELKLEYFSSCMGESEEFYTLGVFESAQHLIGIATFKRDKRSKARHKSYIHTMFVHPDYRGRGHAYELLKGIVDAAKLAKGLEQIHLWVLNPETSKARKLYLKFGFKPQGLIVKNDLKINDNYVDAEYLTMSLD